MSHRLTPIFSEDAMMAFDDDDDATQTGWRKNARWRMDPSAEEQEESNHAPCCITGLPLHPLNRILRHAVFDPTSTCDLEDPSLVTAIVHGLLSSSFSFRLPRRDGDSGNQTVDDLAIELASRMKMAGPRERLLKVRMNIKYSTAADLLRAVQSVALAESRAEEDVLQCLDSVVRGISDGRLADAILSNGHGDAVLQTKPQPENSSTTAATATPIWESTRNWRLDLDKASPCFGTLSALRLTCKEFHRASRMVASPPRYGARLLCALASLLLNHRDANSAMMGGSPSPDLNSQEYWMAHNGLASYPREGPGYLSPSLQDYFSPTKSRVTAAPVGAEPRVYSRSMNQFLIQTKSMVATGPVQFPDNSEPRDAAGCLREIRADGRLVPACTPTECGIRSEQWMAIYHYWPRRCLTQDAIWNVLLHACRTSVEVPRRSARPQYPFVRSNSDYLPSHLTMRFNTAIIDLENSYSYSPVHKQLREMAMVARDRQVPCPLNATRVGTVRPPSGYWMKEQATNGNDDVGDCASPPVGLPEHYTHGHRDAKMPVLKKDPSTDAMRAFLLMLLATASPRASLADEARVVFMAFARCNWLSCEGRWKTLPSLVLKFCNRLLDELGMQSASDKARRWLDGGEREVDDDDDSGSRSPAGGESQDAPTPTPLRDSIAHGLCGVVSAMNALLTATESVELISLCHTKPTVAAAAFGPIRGRAWCQYFCRRKPMTLKSASGAADALRYALRTGLLPGVDAPNPADVISWRVLVRARMNDLFVMEPLRTQPADGMDAMTEELKDRISPYLPMMLALAEHRIWVGFHGFVCSLLHAHGAAGARVCVELANAFVYLHRQRQPNCDAHGNWKAFFEGKPLATMLRGIINRGAHSTTLPNGKIMEALKVVRALWNQQR